MNLRSSGVRAPGLRAPEVRRFRRALLAFFDARARDLPWRGTTDPYAIFVSESMLQQTRVETVKPYFRRWMGRFPTVATLAAADEDEVLRLWEGLGYYSRARNLHAAVREIAATYGGRVPDDPQGLRALPGVGPYTAGAVASIAFGRVTPAIDGNARRVLARLVDLPDPKPAELERLGTALVDPERPGAFNQALMELGSLVCTPRTPACGKCPVGAFCRARRAGTQEERPARRTRKAIPHHLEVVAVLVDRRARRASRVLVRRRPSRGLLAGMWELPGREVLRDADAGRAARKLARELLGDIGPAGSPGVERAPRIERSCGVIPAVDHAFSHRKVTYLPILFTIEHGVATRRERAAPSPLRWVDRAEADSLAFPRAQRRLLDGVWEVIGAAKSPFAGAESVR